MKSEFDLIDKIVIEKNMTKLFALKNNGAFSIALHQILANKYESDNSSLNKEQLNLLMCMNLENAGQSDSILSFLQEWHPHYVDRIVKSLKEIGAFKSSEIIADAIKLLPEDGSWFFDKSSEEDELLMENLDREFSDYPDGFMRNLYKTYSTIHKTKIIKL